MEFQTLLESRRSVRSYDASKTVTREQIKEIVEAGILAPSWKNSQTARYYCVIDEAAKEKFAKECLPEFNINSIEWRQLLMQSFHLHFPIHTT